MNLDNEFTVPVPVDVAWPVLLDVERVAPCMPGAKLLAVDGDTFSGSVRVKVGPVQMTYKGDAKFVTKDDDARRAVIEASGKEARGSGTAAATVTIEAIPAGETTRVKVLTDLNVTGRPAQFGRGVLAEVAGKLVKQFADRLAKEVTATQEPETQGAETQGAETQQPEAPASETPAGSTATPAATVSATPVAATAAATDSDAIDLLGVAGGSVLRRLAPALAAVLLVVVVLVRRRRTRRG